MKIRMRNWFPRSETNIETSTETDSCEFSETLIHEEGCSDESSGVCLIIFYGMLYSCNTIDWSLMIAIWIIYVLIEVSEHAGVG